MCSLQIISRRRFYPSSILLFIFYCNELYMCTFPFNLSSSHVFIATRYRHIIIISPNLLISCHHAIVSTYRWHLYDESFWHRAFCTHINPDSCTITQVRNVLQKWHYCERVSLMHACYGLFNLYFSFSFFLKEKTRKSKSQVIKSTI